MQPPDQQPPIDEANIQALITEFNRLIEQVSELEISSSEHIFRNHHTIETINREIQEIRGQIDELAKRQSVVVQRNTQNIAFLRNCGIGALAIASFASALNWSAGQFSWHGDRLHSIIIAIAGCGGLAFLGFRKIEDKGDND